MSKFKAWSMAVVRLPYNYNPFYGLDKIKRLGFQALAVTGLYDIVVEVTGNSLEEIYRNVSQVSNLACVAGNTPYLAVRSCEKTKQRSNVCILIDTASQDVESVWEYISSIEEVGEAAIVLGVFDIVAMGNVSREGLARLLEKIGMGKGIIRVVAMMELPRP